MHAKALNASRMKKIAFALGVVVALLLLSGFFVAPPILRAVLEKQVARAIDRPVAVGAVRVNPLTLTVTLKEPAVREKTGEPFLEVAEALADLDMTSLFKRALVFSRLRVVEPALRLVRREATVFNFSDLLQPRPAGTTPPEKRDGLPLAIDDIQIVDGRVVMEDRVVSATHRIEALNLSVADFSGLPGKTEHPATVNLSLRFNDAPISVNGQARPFGRERTSTAQVALDGLQVPPLLAHVPLPETLRVVSP